MAGTTAGDAPLTETEEDTYRSEYYTLARTQARANGRRAARAARQHARNQAAHQNAGNGTPPATDDTTIVEFEMNTAEEDIGSENGDDDNENQGNTVTNPVGGDHDAEAEEGNHNREFHDENLIIEELLVVTSTPVSKVPI